VVTLHDPCTQVQPSVALPAVQAVRFWFDEQYVVALELSVHVWPLGHVHPSVTPLPLVQLVWLVWLVQKLLAAVW
jgi:hypothetical protein